MTSDLREYYLRALPGRIEAIESSLRAAATDAEARANVRRIAHSLKGSGASYGFPKITEAAGAAEAADDAALADRMAVLLDVMREAIGSGAAAKPERRRILIVDDDPDVVFLIRSVLDATGHELVTAGDVASAEAALAADTPSLIVLDLVLPDGDGRSLLMRLRERPATASTPVIVLTATSSERARAECIALGADQVVPKPFDPALLAAAVRHQLDRTDRLRETSHRDPLTGLANRAAMSEAWADAVNRAAQPMRLAMLDLDRFREVNERFGAGRGDTVLSGFARMAREELAHARVVARWGGEEFAALYEGEGAVHAEAELQRLVERARTELHSLDDASVAVSVSAGLADASERPALDEAIARAEYYLYLAKTTGRDRLVSADAPIEAPTQRILLAEDDELTASLILHRLRREGFDVEHHNVGTRALDAARSGRYALAILDVKMPGLDGFQLLRELRAMPSFRDVPVLMLTSMGSEDDVVRGFQLGATDYVLKPFSPVELVARVQRHLRKL